MTTHTIISFNVNGIRAINNKHPALISAIATECKPDVLCLQEIKTNSAADLEQYRSIFPNIHCRFSDARKGYSGVSILSTAAAPPLTVTCPTIGVAAPDTEGRVIVAEFEKYIVVNCYTPNSKTGLARLEERLEWDAAFSIYLQGLAASNKPLIVVGDLNCAHQEIDICRPTSNRRSPGFTQQERDSFTCLLAETGLIDTFRAHNPTTVKYSWWSPITNARSRNAGWRIDYILAPQSLAPHIESADILNDYYGSDHCPVSLTVKI